jgi:Rieske Fe-S protein
MLRDQRSSEGEDQAIDPAIQSPGRQGLLGHGGSAVPERTRESDDVTVPPDHGPMDQQPRWRQDFPVDWPADQYVARRDFGRFLVLTSGAFVVGQAWIAAQHLVRANRPAPPRARIAALDAVPVGSAIVFAYPGPQDRCLLIRPDERTLVAYSQSCTHLSCAVIPRVNEGVLHCPCHEGYFDLLTGRNIAGPPPRPLPKIVLEIERNDVYAVGIEERAG